jgi:DNA repair photolyase
MNFLGVELKQPDIFSSNVEFIKSKDNKDNGQREFCGCIISKDIGEYNTCPHQCEYCYANTSKQIALSNYKTHKQNPNDEMILGV